MEQLQWWGNFLGTSRIGRGIVLEQAAMVRRMVLGTSFNGEEMGVGTSCNGEGIVLGTSYNEERNGSWN